MDEFHGNEFAGRRTRLKRWYLGSELLPRTVFLGAIVPSLSWACLA